MYKGNKILAIIPARAGSIRLPNKNKLLFLNVPLIEWTIKQALTSTLIDRIYVTTNDKSIYEITNKYKNVILIKRPESLSTAKTKIYDVIKHCLNNSWENFILLQPTSPLRTLSDIKQSIKLYFDKKADSIISICETECPLEFCNYIGKDLLMKDFIRKKNVRRSQDYKKSYMLNGAIYVANSKKYIENKGFFMDYTYAYIMNRINSIDIDTIEDFKYAEFLFKNAF